MTRDSHTIREMFRELGGAGQLEEALYQRQLWKRGWYQRLTPAERELVKQAQRSYAKLPGVREARLDWHRRYHRLRRRYGPARAAAIWRERQAAGRALNALAVAA